ncbi:MAG TPA: hypothetical protein VFR37_07055 [Longimicrobium sp.]|nr:hypothetical protein [Longimicrobium sp.]
MHPITLNDAERALLAPAMKRAAYHEAQKRAAVDEVARLLSMRTGLPRERIWFNPRTFTVTEAPAPSTETGAGAG